MKSIGRDQAPWLEVLMPCAMPKLRLWFFRLQEAKDTRMGLTTRKKETFAWPQVMQWTIWSKICRESGALARSLCYPSAWDGWICASQCQSMGLPLSLGDHV